jgi:hypothetical protein
MDWQCQYKQHPPSKGADKKLKQTEANPYQKQCELDERDPDARLSDSVKRFFWPPVIHI